MLIYACIYVTIYRYVILQNKMFRKFLNIYLTKLFFLMFKSSMVNEKYIRYYSHILITYAIISYIHFTILFFNVQSLHSVLCSLHIIGISNKQICIIVNFFYSSIWRFSDSNFIQNVYNSRNVRYIRKLTVRIFFFWKSTSNKMKKNHVRLNIANVLAKSRAYLYNISIVFCRTLRNGLYGFGVSKRKFRPRAFQIKRGG